MIPPDAPNQAPQVALRAKTTIAAGSYWWGAGGFTDPDSTSWTYRVDYGDGAGPQPLELTAGQLKLEHVFTSAGDYTVVLTVTDDKGASGSAQVLVHVTDPVPLRLKAPVAVAKVGEPVALTASFTDLDGRGDTHTATWAIGGQQVPGRWPSTTARAR
ncbi:PKD domain-containing protein [Microbispora sp. NEAU-D428]|uniref:PKD domain-containing protein n=1 Tax=Microbispora sitophila TaxID=2771537 RepID=UPI0018675A06|nr:PKD domain-containing protein [Microbispora sitophila]MBE3015208.1 PKD domain-containing protein [Microbispora sitophila]